MLNELQIESGVVCLSIQEAKIENSVGCQVNLTGFGKRDIFSTFENRTRPRIVESRSPPPPSTIPNEFKRRNPLHYDARVTKI